MRITLESDYALRIITAIATHPGITDAGTLAEETSVPQRFALKILNKLVKGGLVKSFKGIRGGYAISRSTSEITLRTVIELIEGPIAIARCVENAEACSLNCDKAACIYHHIFDSISLDLAKKLDSIKLSDIIEKTHDKGEKTC